MMLGGVESQEERLEAITTRNQQDSGRKRQWRIKVWKGIKLHSQFLVIRAEAEGRLQSASKVLRWRWWGAFWRSDVDNVCIECGERWLDPPYVR
jgi:hypothetical protein